MDIKRKYANDLLKFLNSAPTPFQSVDELEKMLAAAGATKLDEGDEWNVERGKL
jgi:aspartyl aminopeptidase